MGKLVPEEGFEPSWDYASRWILSPALAKKFVSSYFEIQTKQ